MESEDLLFLDTDTYRKLNYSYGHTACRKPTHTNLYLNSGSYHHLTFPTFYPGEHVIESHSYGSQNSLHINWKLLADRKPIAIGRFRGFSTLTAGLLHPMKNLTQLSCCPMLSQPISALEEWCHD
jgi:hypothetical protein